MYPSAIAATVVLGLSCGSALCQTQAPSDGCIQQSPEVACSSAPAAASDLSRTHVTTSVTVFSDSRRATTERKEPQPDSPAVDTVTGVQVADAAGAYSDVPRYLQTLPGVTFANDSRNDYLVHGGNPLENLTVVDGVEIPNLNFISTAATSGGFVSMLNTDAISTASLHSMLYGTQYSGALSSVLDIRTVPPEATGMHGEASVGFAGADVLVERPVGEHGSSLLEFRKSVVNYFTNDIGFDGVPVYWSVLSHSTLNLGTRDSLSLLYLQGVDSLNILPNIHDSQDPGLVNTLYGGSRGTAGLTWLHQTVAHGTHKFQVVYSRVHSTMLQTTALGQNTLVSSNNLLDSPGTLRYDLTATQGHLSLQAGAQAIDHGLSYDIQQPNGYPSPYRVDPAPVEASSLHSNLSPLDTAGYAQLAFTGPFGSGISGGVRLQHFGIDHATELSPQVDLRGPAFHHAYLFAGIARYAQLPPMPILLSFAGNRQLLPIRDTQMQAGAMLYEGKAGRLTASVYRKRYFDYPVSTEFASLSLADIVDPFGQPLLAMPMVSAGTGVATGSEIEYTSDSHRRAFLNANLSTQSVRHAALDGISRPATYDIPLALNLLSGVHLGRHSLLTARYSQRTGTPYTPFLLGPSQQQERPIYDLTQIDTQRGSLYARLDARYQWEGRLGGHAITAYAGLENVLGRANYYQYVILPGCSSSGPYELTQQGRFGDGGAIWHF